MVLETGRIQKHNKARYAKVIECIGGHYENVQVPFGRVYRWYPECIVAECGCGERMILTCSTSSCAECATDYAPLVEEWLPAAQPQAYEDLHPWHQQRDCEGESLPS
jgi:hypothetical protein